MDDQSTAIIIGPSDNDGHYYAFEVPSSQQVYLENCNSGFSTKLEVLDGGFSSISDSYCPNANCDNCPIGPLDAGTSQEQFAMETRERKLFADCCAGISAVWDELQKDCEFDACVVAGGDASVRRIGLTVVNIFQHALDMLCAIPDIDAKFAADNLVAEPLPTSAPAPTAAGPTDQPTRSVDGGTDEEADERTNDGSTDHCYTNDGEPNLGSYDAGAYDGESYDCDADIVHADELNSDNGSAEYDAADHAEPYDLRAIDLHSVDSESHHASADHDHFEPDEQTQLETSFIIGPCHTTARHRSRSAL